VKIFYGLRIRDFVKNTIKTYSPFIAGILLGAAIWWLSPSLAGKIEPWDAPLDTYRLCLFIAGFLAALPNPQKFWLSTIGIYFGQFLYAFLFLPLDPLCVVGMLFGLVFIVNALFGGVLVYIFWKIISNWMKKDENEPRR